MGANLNTELNLNPLLDLILKNPYGLFICCVVIGLILLVTLIFFIAKSGILGSLREHQEYKARKIKEEIKDQEDLLEDVSFKKYKDQIQYNLDVTKLNKVLKYSHHDKELLEYILSCKDHKLAIMYYESAKGYLEKDQSAKEYKLKGGWRTKYANALNQVGTFVYFSIAVGSLSPTPYILYLCISSGQSLNKVPFNFFISQFFLYIVCLILALMILAIFVKPWKAKQFLELEKISPTE